MKYDKLASCVITVLLGNKRETLNLSMLKPPKNTCLYDSFIFFKIAVKNITPSECMLIDTLINF